MRTKMTRNRSEFQSRFQFCLEAGIARLSRLDQMTVAMVEPAGHGIVASL